MGRKIIPARMIGTGVPSVLSVAYTTGQTFKKGAIVIYVAAGTVSEAGADPALVCGIALEDAGSKPGFDAANSPTVITGRVQEVSIAVADRHTIFSMRGENAGVIQTPLQTNIDEVYGVVKVGNDWVLDLSETVATVFEVVDIDVDNRIFFCKFMESRIQTP